MSSAAVSALLSAAESDALPPAPLLSGGKRLLASCFRAICTKQQFNMISRHHKYADWSGEHGNTL
jgi:hypothetical protein